MLVLSRQRGEAIMIGDQTEITIVDIRGDKVRLGIRAPKETKVHRREVFELIQRENQAASRMIPDDLLTANGTPSTLPETTPRASMENGMDEFLRAAIDEAKQGLKEGGLPIGSVLVREGKIVAAGHNRRVQHGNPMAHAEIDCLTKAGRQKTYRDTVLYSTLMPCYLCSGAVVQFGIPRVIVGESVNFPGGPEFMKQHKVDVVDLHDAECIEMMKHFIAERPELWNEDIGK